MDRRNFFSRLGKVTIASSVASAVTARAAEKRAEQPPVAEVALPTISLGPHQLSRLVVGSNPLLGYSYMGPHSDRLMREYFTVERSVEFLLACERAGITAHQFSYSPKRPTTVEILRKVRERGSRMKVFCLAGRREDIRSAIAETQPIAIVHHGGVTDRCFAAGRSSVVHDF
ncbi:MAG TPA: hypothetical protein EYP14_00490, partial [Planctomycetaceae bacterium]|nr:hypothetical protein [Planctomycetaceae bacterium]